jgi:hypothetical protein
MKEESRMEDPMAVNSHKPLYALAGLMVHRFDEQGFLS